VPPDPAHEAEVAKESVPSLYLDLFAAS